MAKRKNTISRVVKKESGREQAERADGVDSDRLFKMISLSDDIANGSQS